MTPDLFGDVSGADTGARSDFDFYETPAWMTRSLLRFVPGLYRSRVIECCSGRDAIATVLRDEGHCTVWTNDLDERHTLAHTHEDARTASFWRKLPFADWVVTNPPYNEAFEIVRQAVASERVACGVIMLLRKTWAEPTEERGEWLMQHTVTREVRQPRHNFRGKHSDSCACDWMIWDRDGVSRPFVTDALAKTRRGVNGSGRTGD